MNFTKGLTPYKIGLYTGDGESVDIEKTEKITDLVSL